MGDLERVTLLSVCIAPFILGKGTKLGSLFIGRVLIVTSLLNLQAGIIIMLLPNAERFTFDIRKAEP